MDRCLRHKSLVYTATVGEVDRESDGGRFFTMHVVQASDALGKGKTVVQESRGRHQSGIQVLRRNTL